MVGLCCFFVFKCLSEQYKKTAVANYHPVSCTSYTPAQCSACSCNICFSAPAVNLHWMQYVYAFCSTCSYLNSASVPVYTCYDYAVPNIPDIHQLFLLCSCRAPAYLLNVPPLCTCCPAVFSTSSCLACVLYTRFTRDILLLYSCCFTLDIIAVACIPLHRKVLVACCYFFDAISGSYINTCWNSLQLCLIAICLVDCSVRCTW